MGLHLHFWGVPVIYFKPMTNMLEWTWIKERTHAIRCEDTQGIVAYREGEIQAAAAFDSFTDSACSVHIAMDNPFAIKYGFLREIANHLFITCGRKRIFGLVPSNNVKALAFDYKIGMKELTCIPNAVAEGVDYVVLHMPKEECVWLHKEPAEVSSGR
jgi:hypothetical protein